MNSYVIRIISYTYQQPAIVKSVLGCPTVSKLIFPATLPIHPNEGISLMSDSEFDLTLAPKQFYAKSFVRIPLHSQNNIKFSMTIYDQGAIVPNTLNLKFDSQHLEKKIITLETLKALLFEVIPIFQADHASVHYQDTNIHAKPSRYLPTPDYRSYPLGLHWINYFGAEMISLLGRDRLTALKSCATKYDFHQGIVIILQEEPFCKDNITHKRRQSEAEGELRLQELAPDQLMTVLMTE